MMRRVSLLWFRADFSANTATPAHRIGLNCLLWELLVNAVKRDTSTRSPHLAVKEHLRLHAQISALHFAPTFQFALPFLFSIHCSQGRHLLPNHSEEAPAAAGGGAALPPALRLPG